MAIDKADLSEIKQIIKDSSHMRSSDNLSNFFTKIALALCISGIIWIMNSVSSMNTSFIRIEEQQKQSIEQMAEFKEFAAEPRFTERDFAIGITILRHRIETTENYLIELKAKIISLELKYSEETQ